MSQGSMAESILPDDTIVRVHVVLGAIFKPIGLDISVVSVMCTSRVIHILDADRQYWAAVSSSRLTYTTLGLSICLTMSGLKVPFQCNCILSNIFSIPFQC